MTHLSTRLASFTDAVWLSEKRKTELARAGFFYYGIPSDYAHCFTCQLTVRVDNPGGETGLWTTHFARSPFCPFISHNIGELELAELNTKQTVMMKLLVEQN